MHDVGPFDRIGQLAAGAIDKHEGFVTQHRGQTWMQRKAFHFLKTEPDNKIRLVPHGVGHSQNERFDSAVCALTWADQKKLALFHLLAA